MPPSNATSTKRTPNCAAHLADFVAAYNFARRLKTLKGLTPYEFICKLWTKEPDRFILDPLHQMPGLNSLKDTVLVSPGERIRILKPFEDFKGRFMFHCHILEHEDMGMMRQFLVE